MPVGVSEEHEELRRTVARWMEEHCPPGSARPLLDAEVEELQPVWKELAAQGWLGLHIPEKLGGQGFGLPELSVVLEEAGRAMLPGPLLTSVAAAALIAAAAPGSRAAAEELVPVLSNGSLVAGISMGAASLAVTARGRRGAVEVSGVLPAVLGAAVASMPAIVLAPVADPGGSATWCVLEVGAAGFTVEPARSLDPTRRVARVAVESVTVPIARQLPSLRSARVRDLLVTLVAAECAGGARWCLETARAHANVRVQFGRPIGQFQAVKHRIAEMLVRAEEAAAVAWDASFALDAALAAGVDGPDSVDGPDESSLAACVAGAIAVEAFASCAKDCIQLLGGVGFTWEHDAHLYLKRAAATRQLVGESASFCEAVAGLAGRGVRRSLATELPGAAEIVGAEIAPLVAEIAARRGVERRRRLVEAGLLVPHWPRPWGRDAGPVEQLVIDRELQAAGVHRPNLGIGAWALPTLIAHGSPDQLERWVRPTMLGELTWCQLFSEPGAGSDLAALRTRAARAEGGWRLTGQKVWTSMAQTADLGICLARTNPSAPKHDGITYFVVDMRAQGVDIRALREITGEALFNEVFLDEVFVPDSCVVGAVDGGWQIARATLANERVSISSGAAFGHGVEALLDLVASRAGGGEPLPPWATLRLGELVAEAQALRLLHHRATLRSLAGTDPGAGASVRKLVSAQHEQRVQELGLALFGVAGALADGAAAQWVHGFLATRCLTIAGGTSEVQRNVIAERILGLPRDPEPA